MKQLATSQKRLSVSICNISQNSINERRGYAKSKKEKNSSFQTTITKSVFLYGRPNKEKLVILQQMQNSYTALINRDIDLLEKNPDIVLQLVKNDKKDPQMRKLEKAIRPEGINSAFCQNAFDAAVVQVSGRLNNIFCQKVWGYLHSQKYCLPCLSWDAQSKRWKKQCDR